MQVPLSRPDISEHEIEAVTNVLKTPYLSMGPKLIEFENKLAEYLGIKRAIAVNSGTSALHLAVKSTNLRENDEIITSPFSFVASANCALYVNSTPRFIDISLDTLNIDPNKIYEFIEENCYVKPDTGHLFNANTNRRVKAILPVHIFGNACEMDVILRLATQYHLDIIEDACEALGSEYKGQKVGTFGKIGVFAFYPNKQITTGEGGALVTNDSTIARLCRSYRNQGRNEKDEFLLHERLGYNYRLSDINCALGIAQLNRIDEILTTRNQVARIYNEKLEHIEEIKIPDTARKSKKSWFVYVIQLTHNFTMDDRDEIMNGLKSRGIACRNYFSPIHLQPYYRAIFGYKEGDFPVTELVSQRTIALPFFNTITPEQIEYVVFHIKKEIRRVKNKHRIILEQLKKDCDLKHDLKELFI